MKTTLSKIAKSTLAFLLIIAAVACKKKEEDKTPSNSSNANISGYNCISGNCESVSSNAVYNTLSQCEASCGSVNTSGYNCVSGNCESVSSNATYVTLTECQNACETSGCEGNFTTFTDPRDGQVYNIIQIGSQIWFAENLRYSGGSIIHVIDNVDWPTIFSSNANQPSWSYYDNNPDNDAIYGKLYNRPAVNTSTLCPEGWHIPTDAEWTTLITFLDPSTDGTANSAEFGQVHSAIGGEKMKSTTGWPLPNLVTNESCFTALPGGSRSGLDGTFMDGGANGHWWSSSAPAWGRTLKSGNNKVERNNFAATNGLSCRCVMD
jgi:uncharacterized protein (TIGR02145 family)